jgi:hypothetical protein
VKLRGPRSRAFCERLKYREQNTNVWDESHYLDVESPTARDRGILGSAFVNMKDCLGLGHVQVFSALCLGLAATGLGEELEEPAYELCDIS